MGRLLTHQPLTKVANLADLVGIANALEIEAARRYAQLAEAMERRGENETARTFRELEAEEAAHKQAVEDWAASLGQSAPKGDFVWRLPKELGESWDEVSHSSLLTPYRALAIAVTNEERAFAFYTYIAAQSDDPEIARQAEKLAREELSHAAFLRRMRRVAWRREQESGSLTPHYRIEELEDFQEAARTMASQAANAHVRLAMALRADGEEETAALLLRIACEETSAFDDRHGESQAAKRATGLTDQPPLNPVRALYLALKPLEQMAEVYEDLAEHAANEEVMGAAQDALIKTVERIALLADAIERAEAE